MSNYDHLQLRYSCFSEPSLVSCSHPRSLSLRQLKPTNPSSLAATKNPVCIGDLAFAGSPHPNRPPAHAAYGCQLRRHSKIILFPVDRPGDINLPTYPAAFFVVDLFLYIFFFILVNSCPIFQTVFTLILKMTRGSSQKKKISEKKDFPAGQQETDIFLVLPYGGTLPYSFVIK